MNKEYDQQSAYSKIRQPFKRIPCQQLVSSADTTSGWVRRKKNKKWNQIYMVLHKGCIYYYENELSRTEIEGFSLFGFKSVEVATECLDNKALWVFKLVHLHPSVFRAQYFSAASENELKFWINGCTKEIKNANGGDIQEPQYDDWYEAVDDVDSQVESSTSSKYDARRYSYPRAGIGYRVPPKRPLPSLPGEYVNAVGNQHVKHRSGSQCRSDVVPPWPPIPPRRTNETSNNKDQRDCTDIGRLDKPAKRSSLIEEEVDNASNVTDKPAKRRSLIENEVDNASNVTDKLAKRRSLIENEVDNASSVTGKTDESSSLSKKGVDNASNITGKPEESSSLSEQTEDKAANGTVKFRARANFDYAADDDNELSFLENQIIDVLDYICEGWWYGKSNGFTGMFPSNYVEEITEDDLAGFIISRLNKKQTSEESLYDDNEGYALVHESEDSLNEKEEDGVSDKNDNSYSSVWDRSSMTDIQRQYSKRVIPAVLTRLNHESVSTYLRCLKDGDERSNGIRLVIVGRQNTGKTCLTKRLLKESVENVQKTNGLEIHTLKCRGKVDERGWIFQDGRTYENEIHSRLLKCCIEESKMNLPTDSEGYMYSQGQDAHISLKSEKGVSEVNESNFTESDMGSETFYQAQEVPVQDFFDLYDIIDADIDDEDTAPIALWDFAGDREHFNTHQTFFGQESIYVVVANVKDIIENVDSEYGLAFWLETIRSHCKLSVDKEYYDYEYQEPPVIIVGTHKDRFEGTKSDCETKFQRQVHEIVRNSKIRRNIRKMYVISNTNDTDDQFDILRGDIVEIAKSRKQWNIKTPARWIHLEKALSDENALGKPVVAKSDIVEIANQIIQPIKDEEEIELFLTFHTQSGIGTYVYFSDLPDYVILDPQWLANAFGCIITADQFQKNLVHQTEWEELRQHGRLSEKLLNEIFLHQEENIQKYRTHLLKIMEKFNIIVRPRTISDTNEIHEESDYYVPCMIKNTSLSIINETFYPCSSKSSCLCVEFDFLPPSFATKVLVACTRYYTIAKGPQKPDGRHPAFYRDFAIYNLDATGCEKLLIANCQNVLQLQIWKWGEPERHSYNDVKAKVIGIIEEMKEILGQPSLSYELKLKCQYTDYECLDGMVEPKVITPQKEYFCEEHGNTHSSGEIYFDWLGEIEQKIFSREQINATRMAIIILEILTNALYDLLISDCGGFSVKPRDECDITYLYAQLRRNNKHIPGHGWGCKWSDIQNSNILIGDDIERIRLTRNDMAHSKKFSLDDNKYYDLCGILERVLHRLEMHNGKGKLYTDQMKNVKKKETNPIDWQTYQKKITSEFPRLKMKPSFEVKVGGGCTLECETVVPLPDGSTVYWVKEKNSEEVELTVDETTSNKYKGSQFDYPSLNIYCASKEDEGHYSCRIRYPQESAESMDENITWPKTCLHVNN